MRKRAEALFLLSGIAANRNDLVGDRVAIGIALDAILCHLSRHCGILGAAAASGATSFLRRHEKLSELS